MRAAVSEEQVEHFNPVTVTVVLESKRELEAFYGLFVINNIEQIMRRFGLNVDEITNQVEISVNQEYSDDLCDEIFEEIRKAFAVVPKKESKKKFGRQ